MINFVTTGSLCTIDVKANDFLVERSPNCFYWVHLDSSGLASTNEKDSHHDYRQLIARPYSRCTSLSSLSWEKFGPLRIWSNFSSTCCKSKACWSSVWEKAQSHGESSWSFCMAMFKGCLSVCCGRVDVLLNFRKIALSYVGCAASNKLYQKYYYITSSSQMYTRL